MTMKKKILALFLALLAPAVLPLRAQTLVDNYRFSTRLDPTAWIDITGVDSALVTPPASGWITDGGLSSQLTDIGFTFSFAGTDYTTFGTNLMGAVRLGARIVGTQSGSTILSTTSTLPKVDGLGVRGMVGSSCYIRCATVGTAGNRVLVVEYRLGIYQHDSTYVSWQTQLHEATGEVWLVYGPSEGISQLPTTQPGLAKSNTDMLFLDMANHSVQRLASTPVPVNAVGVWPEEGRCYIFTPDNAACPAPPTVTALSSDPDSAVLSLSAGGLVCRLRIPALGLDTLMSDSLLLLSGINPTTVYNGTIQTVCGADSSLRVRTFTFTTTGCGTVRLLPWADDFQLAASNDCWPKPYKASGNRWQRQTASNNSYMRTGYSTVASTVYNEWLITPPVVLPDVEGITMSWDYKSEQYNNAAPKVRVRLLVCDTTEAVDTTADWMTLTTIEDYEQDFQLHQLSLDAYAGHRVRVAFQRYGSGGKYAYVDNVSIEVLAAPSVVLQVPGDVNAGDTTAVVAVLTAGVLSNPQWQWTSAMEARGEAVIVSADDTLKIIYLTAGRDTVSVTLTTNYGTATATASYSVCGQITTFPWHEGFEQGFTCWEMPTSGSNVWDLRTTGAHSGQRVACATTHDVYNPFDTLVSQPIVVPADAHGLTLLWWMKRDNSSSTNMNYRHILIKALPAANPIWATADTLFYINGAGFSTSYQQYTVDLEPLAGQTIRLAWTGSSYESGKYIYIDDIEIRYTREPVGSFATSAARVYEGDTVTATVTLTEGDTVGLSYQWESTMATLGMANVIGGGPQVSIAYSGVGIDTVVVTVSNTYGSFTDTSIVRVCPVQDTLPWVVNFSNDFPCWQVLSGTCEVNSYGYLILNGFGPTTVVSPSVYVPDDGNVVLEYDYAYSFFYGNYLVMVTTDMITFDTLGDFPFVSGTHLPTRIPLNDYADQHIRVVFKAMGDFLQFYLINMSVRYAFEPEVSLTVDDGYFPGTPMTLTANLLEGDTNGITYSFTSTKAQNGEATLVQDGGPQATLTCYTGGPDTVTVVVTNAYGSDTAWTVVNVRPCDTVDALLWTENFDNYYTCWWQPEGSQWTLPENPGFTMAVAINVWQSTDSWLISRAITLPALPVGVNDELLLCWDATTQFNDTHSYCVMITTAPDYRDLSSYDTLAAFDTVHPDYSIGWSAMRARLSAYAGQTVHLAFRYTTQYYEPNGLPGILIIDNVRIIDTTYAPPLPDTVWRTVTVLSADSTMGTVSGGGSCMDSTTVTIRANALQGYEFVAWNDGDTLNPRQVFVVSDTAFTALFREVEDSVGIAGVRAGEWRLYPNPARGSVMVEVVQPEVLTLLDVSGREVLRKRLSAGGTRVDISALPQGVYFVRLDGNALVKKLIVR